jgi:hypothetical protein
MLITWQGTESIDSVPCLRAKALRVAISSGSNPNRRRITVNPISRTHAEADARQQAFDVGVRGNRARLIIVFQNGCTGLHC